MPTTTTTTTVPTATTATDHPTAARRRLTAPGAAGLTYVGAWVAGLVAFPPGPAQDAPAAEVGRFYADHAGAATAQAVLVHGVAAVALLAVLLAVRARGRSTPLAHAAGVTGVALSLVQLALEVWRGAWAGSHPATTVDALFDAVNRLDGLKMLAFAVLIGAAVGAFRASGLSGPRMVVVGWSAVVALVVSGAGYLVASPVLGAAAFASLPLLLLWVAATGVAAGRVAR